jgi:hypothetical protein
VPLVFFTNQPSASGMVQGNVILRHDRGQTAQLANLAGGLITNVDEMIARVGAPSTIRPEDGIVPSLIAATDPNFKMPQVWKSSIAFDYQLPTSFPMSVTVEGIFNNMINDVTMENWNARIPDETWERFSGPDNRFIYPAGAPAQSFVTVPNPTGSGNITPQAFILTNTNKGWGAIGNITVTAQPVRNMNLMAAYTYTESKELTGMPGSSANSIFQNTNTVNGPVLLDLQRSQYVIPHRVIGSFGYSTPTNPWAGKVLANTHFNVFYSGASSNGFSYIFTNDMNRDGFGRDLIWIPSQRGDIKFINQEHEDVFFAFMEQDKYLKRNKGSYAEANAVRAPWVHRFDLRIARDFKINKNTIQLSMDVTNFGNLLNSKWGIPKNQAHANGGAILTYVSRDADNVPTFAVPTNNAGEFLISESWTTNYSIGNTWRLQFGVRYTFN